MPSEFMTRMAIEEDIKAMGTLEIVRRLRYETENNGCTNWSDAEPAKCWYRAQVVELGLRVYPRLQPKEWGDWEDNWTGLLCGLAGYDDHVAFRVGEMFSLTAEDWDEMEAFLEREQAGAAGAEF